jgi:spore coat protein U-like protein
VVSNCLITTATVAFGSYDPIVTNAASALAGTGTLTVSCTKGTTATVGLNDGANPSGGTRRMADGAGGFLDYELYQDSGHTTVWGNSGGDLLSPVAAPSKTARDFTVYGQVAGNQDVTAGAYSDTIVATVNF